MSIRCFTFAEGRWSGEVCQALNRTETQVQFRFRVRFRSGRFRFWFRSRRNSFWLEALRRCSRNMIVLLDCRCWNVVSWISDSFQETQKRVVHVRKSENVRDSIAEIRTSFIETITVWIWNLDKSGFWIAQKRLGCEWSGSRMGSEIRKPNHLKSRKMGVILSKTIWNPDQNIRILLKRAKNHKTKSTVLNLIFCKFNKIKIFYV